jgi:hypothetical protein
VQTCRIISADLRAHSNVGSTSRAVPIWRLHPDILVLFTMTCKSRGSWSPDWRATMSRPAPGSSWVVDLDAKDSSSFWILCRRSWRSDPASWAVLSGRMSLRQRALGRSRCSAAAPIIRGSEGWMLLPSQSLFAGTGERVWLGGLDAERHELPSWSRYWAPGSLR